MATDIENKFSIKKASESTSANKGVITGCCKNKKGCAYSGGYRWKYIQDIKESEISDSFILQKYVYYMEQIKKRQDFKTTIIKEDFN